MSEDTCNVNEEHPICDNTWNVKEVRAMRDIEWNVEDLRALKRLFVKNLLERRHREDSELETICAVSPDAAITILASKSYDYGADLLPYVVRADNAVRDLADNLDAWGDGAAQANEDPTCCHDAAKVAGALAALQRLAKLGNSPLAKKDKEERNAALRLLIPEMRDGSAPGPVETWSELDPVPF
jgi:hypothetical protein